MTSTQLKSMIDVATALLDMAGECKLPTPATIEEALEQIVWLQVYLAAVHKSSAGICDVLQSVVETLEELDKPAPEPEPATPELLQGWCECGKWKWRNETWYRYGVMSKHDFCDECGSCLHPDGTATPSPMYAPVAPEQPVDTVPPFKPLAEYSILDLSALLETMPERLGVAVRLLLIPPDRNYAGFAVVASPLSGVFFERDKDTAAREAVAMFLKGMEADSGLPEDLAFLAHSRTD